MEHGALGIENRKLVFLSSVIQLTKFICYVRTTRHFLILTLKISYSIPGMRSPGSSPA